METEARAGGDTTDGSLGFPETQRRISNLKLAKPKLRERSFSTAAPLTLGLDYFLLWGPSHPLQDIRQHLTQ